MDKHEMLNAINDAINVADKAGEFGLGDRLQEVLTYLSREWMFSDDDEE